MMAQYDNEITKTIDKMLMNGIHLPLIGGIAIVMGSDPLFITFVLLKSYSYNFYTSFGYLIPDHKWYYLKHLARLTDTGHIASMIFYFDRTYLPLAHNVHFSIAASYWVCYFGLNMKSENEHVDNKYAIQYVDQAYTCINHILPYTIMLYNVCVTPEICPMFNDNSLYNTYVWIYTWFLLIYMPWVYKTGDVLYSVFSANTHLGIKFAVILFVHGIVYISQSLPYYVCDYAKN